ncbi:hypothetical protein BX600DRAFT_444112 [Xylariales sp. PMI_506]|nr:hypothetical protein BX600DRAFT_444112 [Xylariales sp. PMI_506]
MTPYIPFPPSRPPFKRTCFNDCVSCSARDNPDRRDMDSPQGAWNLGLDLQSDSRATMLVDGGMLSGAVVTPMSSPSLFRSSVHSWEDIKLPTRDQSIRLIDHSRVWTSWIHCAVRYQEFEQSHRGFWSRMEAGSSLRYEDPLWLAIYFSLLADQAALLTYNEEDIRERLFLDGKLFNLVHIWYSASIFCLEKADYMRNNNYMAMQAIAVLQMSSNYLGDHIFRNRLMTVGIQIGKDLGLPYPSSGKYSPIEIEYSCRLWWVFIICEWLLPPTHRSMISDDDSNIIYPSQLSEDDLLNNPSLEQETGHHISPWLYHIVLCQISVVNHRFNKGVQGGTFDLQILVRAADEALANIITDLPPHLQPYGDDSQASAISGAEHPWIEWQRVDLTTETIYVSRKYLSSLQSLTKLTFKDVYTSAASSWLNIGLATENTKPTGAARGRRNHREMHPTAPRGKQGERGSRQGH